MSILTQIVPRFARSFDRPTAAVADETNESAFTLKPLFDVKETPEAWNLTVQLPGVTKENLDFTAEHEQIAIFGRRSSELPAGWTTLYRESVDAPYKLVLAHGNSVDVAKIAAELKDGILHVLLPKLETVKPRKVVIG